MKFIALFAIFAIVIATAYAADGDIDPRCPVDESSESQTQYMAHESDCTKYYMCSNSRSYLLECPKMVNGERLHWDAIMEVCNWPADADCKL